MDVNTGVVFQSKICGSLDCGTGEKCVEWLSNPNRGITNFDNYLFASLAVYQCITLEGWTQIMNFTQQAFGTLSLLYFLPLVFIGALIFLNLFMAIIKSALSTAILKFEKFETTENFRSLETTFLMSHFSDVNDNQQSERSEVQFTVLPSKSRLTGRVGTFKNSFDLKIPSKSFLLKDLDPTLAQDKSFQPSDFKSEKLNKTQTLKNISSLFQRMNTQLKINEKVLKRLNNGEKLESTSINIKDIQTFSTSSSDVLPISRFNIPNLMKKQFYSFSYIDSSEIPVKIWNQDLGIEEIQNDWTEFKIFSKLVERFDEVGAFQLIFFPTKTFCGYLRQMEEVTLNVEGGWSGSDVQPYSTLMSFEKLNRMNFRIWKKGFWGKIQKFRFPLIFVIDSKFFQLFILLSVTINTIVLSIDHYGISTGTQESLNRVNIVFAFIFLFEMSVNLLAYGPIRYFRDVMNYFDTVIVVLSLIEVYFLSNSTKSAISAFRVARIFRVFRMLRILRVAKIFRYVKSLAHLVKVIGMNMSRYMYLGLLLFLLLVIYSLIGMEIFAGKFEKSKSFRNNFDSFHASFVTNFQILSVENWQSVLYQAMSSDAGYASCIFIISWIIIGNYIILNLFLAILLESFSSTDLEDMIKVEKENLFKGHSQRMKKKQEERLKLIEDLSSDSEAEVSIEKSNTTKINLMQDPGKSFYIFSKSHKIRQICIKLDFSPIFEYFILFIIFISSIKLAGDTYIKDSDLLKISEIIDYFFSGIFMCEFIIKTISRGLLSGESSYLKDRWNYIDFMVVISSILDLAISSVDFSKIKVTRLLRTLRPFRYINYNTSMKIVVIALLQSIVAILNVVFIQGIVLLMFAILGVSLLAGKLYSCSDQVSETMDECIRAGFEWQKMWPNYDNVLNTFTTLVILSSEEGWPDIMNQAIDARDVEQAPGYNENPMLSYYFIVFITISSFLFMNLFIGVVYEKFNEAKDHEISLAASFLSKEQMIWVDMQKMIVKCKPKKRFQDRPGGRLRKFSYRAYKSVYFQVSMNLLIAFNMVLMSFQYYGASENLTFVMETGNLIFTSFFLLEACIKIFALGFHGYFSSFSNIFDFVVVALSLIDIILTYVLGSTILLLRSGPQMIRIVRVFRVSKLIRLFKALESLQNLIKIIMYSLPSIGNVSALLSLIFFIYSIIGVNLFSGVVSGKIIDSETNFSNFGRAMMTLFRCSTGEDWYSIMFDCGKSVNMFLSQFYFLSFITLVVFVMLNLFAMVIIHHYEEFEKNNGNVRQVFEKEVKKIKVLWMAYSKESKGKRIHVNEVACLIKEIGEFRFRLEDSNEKVLRFLRSLDLCTDKQGFVYFHQFLFAFLRRKYMRKGLKGHLWKVVVNEERKTRAKIKKITENVKKDVFNDRSYSYLEKSTVSSYVIEKGFILKVFLAWKGFVKNRIDKRTKGKHNSIDSIIFSERIKRNDVK
jgi:hypothetical protein